MEAMSSDEPRWVELSDLIVDFRPDGGRRPVAVDDVLRQLDDPRFAASRRLAARLPRAGRHFDEAAVDAILLRSHLELQRLAEEIQHGQRVARLLRPFLELVDGPATVVDVGCGLGYLTRYFAHTGALGADTTVIGVDQNRSLLAAARRLAETEHLDCTFVAGDAFQLDTPATAFLSSGVVHHIANRDLPAFFARQQASGALACFHFDIAPTRLTPLGAWLFHRARMREALARHDGVRSALRAHDDLTLTAALGAGCPGWTPLLFDATSRRPALLNVMRPVIGMDHRLVAPYRRALGRLERRLVAWVIR